MPKLQSYPSAWRWVWGWALGMVMEIPAGAPETGPSSAVGSGSVASLPYFANQDTCHQFLGRRPSYASCDFFAFDLEPSAFWEKTRGPPH